MRNISTDLSRPERKFAYIVAPMDGMEERMPVGTVISLFSGAMGLDLGFENEGFETKVAVENDRAAVKTIQVNRPSIPIMMCGQRAAGLEHLSTEDILIASGLEIGEATVVLGAPPCEPYSTAGKRNGKADHRADAIMQFIRFVKKAQPRFFVFEEVDSLISAAKRHVSFYDRVAMPEEELAEDEKLGSFFDEVMSAFYDTDYTLSFDPNEPTASVSNAADFGVPQKRKRFILIGAREGPPVRLPVPSDDKWVSLREAIEGLNI